YCDQSVPFPPPLPNRRCRCRPEPRLGIGVQHIQQHLTQPLGKSRVGVDFLLPSENAAEKRFMFVGQKPGHRQRIWMTRAVHMAKRSRSKPEQTEPFSPHPARG